MPLELDGLTRASISTCGCRPPRFHSTAKLGRTAIAANLRGGNLTVAIGESQAFGGVIKGIARLAKSTAGAEPSGAAAIHRGRSGQTLGELFGIRRIEGKGNLAFPRRQRQQRLRAGHGDLTAPPT